uniref:Maturase K n=1 Tax=Selaginella uncinata TaxID=307165 RepID=A0A482A2W1_SELUN|nr:maturase K [Selaginella uncinata]QBL07869.1 maturase K [Selaginella uncinata]
MKAWASTGRGLRINNVWCQQRLLHPLPSRDDTHAIAFSSSPGKSDPEQEGVTGPNKKHSDLATIKQPTSGIRRQDASSSSCFAGRGSSGLEGCRDRRRPLRSYTNISLELAVGGPLTMVPQICHPVKARQPLVVHEWNIFRSIPSTFILTEEGPPRCHRFLGTELSYSSHPEIPIRIPRCRIRDAPLPHSPRITLHGHRNSGVPQRSAARSPAGTNGFIIPPWNHYMYEPECRLTRLCGQAPHSRVPPCGACAPNTTRSTRGVAGHIVKGLSRIVEPPLWIVILPPKRILPLPKGEPSIHYARCVNHFMIASKAATSAEKWKHHHPRFRRYHPSARARSGFMDQSFEDCSASLCYVSGTRPEIRKVRARMVGDPLLTGTPSEELLAATPTTHSIGLSAEDKYRSTAGRPTSRSARTILPRDDDVSNRSYRISASIHYCGECSKERNGLYRMQHIPRSSCAKTPARKHGGTIRVARDEYGPGVFRAPPPTPAEGRALLLTGVRRQGRTNWYSDMTRVDCVANHLRRERAPHTRCR